jgi:hypothetical protein
MPVQTPRMTSLLARWLMFNPNAGAEKESMALKVKPVQFLFRHREGRCVSTVCLHRAYTS